MCVLKKPSTPSFGVKLFVSLVLLAISLCLVTCVEETSEVTESVASVKPTFLKKDVTISKADFIGLVNEDPKLFYQLPDAGLTTRIGDLNAAISNTTPTVLGAAGTPAPLKAYSVAGTPPAKSEFHFILPKGKLVKDLLVSNKAALKEEFLKGDTDFQVKLKSVLEDTTAFVSTLVTPGKIATSATITLKELEDHLFTYSLDGDKLKSGTPSIPFNDKITLLFAPIDDIKKIGLKVYIPQLTVKEFLDECATKRGAHSGMGGDIKFMETIISELPAAPASGSPSPPTEVAWADVLEEAEKFGYDSDKMTRDDAASPTLTHFKYESILGKTGTSFEGSREKFRVSFKIPEGSDYKEYLNKLTTEITGTGADDHLKLRDCFAKLVIKANEDASFNSIAVDLFKSADIEDKSVTYDELMTELKTLLKDIPFKFDIAVGDFKEPATDNKRFSYDSAEDKLKLLQLSYLEQETSVEDKKIVKGLVEIAKDETEKVVYPSKADAINAFFSHCWNAEVYEDRIKAKEQGEEGKDPADKKLSTGGDGESAANQTSGNTSGGENNKSKEKTDYTVVIIIVSVVGGGLLLGVIVFLFIKRKKHESNETSA